MKMENVEDIYPLSPVQEGMLFHALQAPTSGVYVEQHLCTLHGDLDISLFNDAWQQVVDRHCILRTAFFWEGLEDLLQVVRQQVDLPWTYHDWQEGSETEQQERLSSLLNAQQEQGFDLTQAPLLHITLIRLAPSIHQLVWTFHHLILDAWSKALILQEVFTLYDALYQGAPLHRQRSRPYRDYIAWQQQQDLAEAERFWQQTLKGFTAPTTLRMPGVSGRELDQIDDYGEQSIALSEATTATLQSVARQHQLTLNTLLQGAWALLLSRYSGEPDVVFGATVAGRPAELAGVEEMVGLFINTLPLRVHITPEDELIPWLQALQSLQMTIAEYAFTPLLKLQSWSDLPPGQALFESILVFENESFDTASDQLSRSLDIRDVQHLARSNFPLALLVLPGPALQLLLIYDCHRFEKTLITHILGHLETILYSLATHPQQRVVDVSMLTDAERQQILVEWNQTEMPLPQNQCWHELFEAQANRTPEATAVIYDDQRLCYRELNARADQLAHHLNGLGVKPGALVGLCVERSLHMMVGIVGILKAGGAYVPLDPAYPAERLAFMLNDTQVSVLVTQAYLVAALPSHHATVVTLDTDGQEQDQPSEQTVARSAGADDLAYVMYTSGSTGQPKGVMVTHRNLMHSTLARTQYYAQPVRRYLLLSTFAFDSSVAGIFWTLSQGGALCIPHEERYKDLSYLGQLIEQHNVSHLLCIPSVWQYVLASESKSKGTPDRLSALTTVIVAGEACSAELVLTHQALLPETTLFNEYGPTEGTVWSTVFDCRTAVASATVPIGRPIPDTRVYVLDAAMQPVPVGATGELYIGGPGVAAGYLHRPELTRDRFVSAPFPEAAGDTLYKTGDRVRYLPDGNLEFLGRDDQQVKLRGYRVELGEIEEVLQQHPDVHHAVVITKREPTGHHPLDALTDPVVPMHQHPEALATQLSKLVPEQAESLLQAIEQLSNRDVQHLVPGECQANEPAPDTKARAASRQTRTHPDFDLTLQFKNQPFIAPPRETQRNWLLNQILDEFSDDLVHLDQVTKRFVSGSAPDFTGQVPDLPDADLTADDIMEDWQIPIMRAMAEHVTESHGEVLEIGFGRGVSATFIQEGGVQSHTIIEANAASIRDFYEPWRHRYPDQNIQLIQGRWQDVRDQLSLYDGIFFHAVPLDETEFINYMVNSITFAEHFFPIAADLLKPNGVFAYLTTEIDSLSRRHQRALFRYFRSLTLSVEPLSIPETTRDAWWADSMVIIKAVK